MIDQGATDRRLKVASEFFAGGRFIEATAVANELWNDGERSPDLARLRGELALLRNDLYEAETVLRAALQSLENHPTLLGMLAETLRRSDRLAEAAWICRELGRTGMAEKLAHLSASGWYRFAGQRCALGWLDASALPAVRARVNGVAANLILDTGVGETLLDTSLARGIGVAVHGAERIQFPAGPAGTVEHATLAHLELGDLSVEDLPVQLHETRAAFAGLVSVPVDGVVGSGLFSRIHTTFDYRGRQLRLDGRQRLDVGEPLYLAGEQYPLVETRLNDRVNTLLFLDTGMSGTAIALTLSTAEFAGVEVAAAGESAGYGVTSTLPARPIRCCEVRAAGSIQQDVPGMLLSRFKLEHRFGFRIGGLLGDGFVNQGTLQLDFSAARVRLSDIAGQGDQSGRESAKG